MSHINLSANIKNENNNNEITFYHTTQKNTHFAKQYNYTPSQGTKKSWKHYRKILQQQSQNFSPLSPTPEKTQNETTENSQKHIVLKQR